MLRNLSILISFTFIAYSFCYSGNKNLEALKDMDSKILAMEDSIRITEIGWVEIITSSETNRFEDRYKELRRDLTPALTKTIQSTREKSLKIKTMGQALSSLPIISADMLTVIDYETRLNHIEFLLNSRRAKIASRLSLMFAVFFGALSIIITVLFYFWGKRQNLQFRKSLDRVDNAYNLLISRLARRRRRFF